jgi:hypothetical protein
MKDAIVVFELVAADDCGTEQEVHVSDEVLFLVLDPGYHGHIVMEKLLMFAVIPLDGNAGPISVDDSAGVLRVRIPDHAGLYR